MCDFCRSTRLRPESRQLGSQAGCSAKQRPIWMMLSAIHPKANPALHAFEPSIPTAIQSVAPLQHADAAFASGPPALPSSDSSSARASRSAAEALLPPVFGCVHASGSSVSLSLCIVHTLHQCGVFQQLIYFFHPWFPQIFDVFR
jgi:hypothetical protein